MSKPSSTNYPIGFLFRIFISSPVRVKFTGCDGLYIEKIYSHSSDILEQKFFQVVIAVRFHLFPFRTEKLSSFVCLALFCFAFLFFVLLVFLGSADFQWGLFYICEVFLFLCFQGIILYRIISYPYHIIYLASISSYAFLFLCLKECYASVYLPLSSLFMVTFDYEIR